MRIIADGGSTKVHWIVTDGTQPIASCTTPGMNPAVMPQTTLRHLIKTHLLPHIPSTIDIAAVEYYGAGCRGEAAGTMQSAISTLFPSATVTVESDMLGACRAIAPGTQAIVCILGTGANSCLYDGTEIIDNVPPLGYILGDEGSGAWLGKNLVADILKGLMPHDVTTQFHTTYPYTYDELIRYTYRPTPDDGSPNTFLASFAPFISTHIHVPQVYGIALRGISLFFERNVNLYFTRHPRLSPDTPIHFVGSVAAAFAPVIREVASSHGRTVGTILRSPLSTV